MPLQKYASLLVWCTGVLSLGSFSPVMGQVKVHWTQQFGGEAPDTALGVATAPNAAYVVGEIENSGNFPGFTTAGKIDAFVSKFDIDGKLIWSRQFGTPEDDVAAAAAADSTGVYVVGYTGGSLQGTNGGGGFSDIFVRKYDPNGVLLWTRQFGGPGEDEGLAAAVDSSALYISGFVSFALPTQTLVGADDIFVRKYDLSGTELWTRQFGSDSVDQGYGLAVDASGVYVTGKVGAALVSEVGGFDGFIRKFDSSGSTVWTRQFGTSQTDWTNAIAVNSSGVYVTGQTTGTFPGQTFRGGLWDAFGMKFDLNGNLQWTRQLGTDGDDFGYGAALGPQWVYFAGQFENAVFVYRYQFDGTDTGNFQQGTGNTRSYAVAADASAAYVAGMTSGSQLGQVGLGQTDAFLIRIPHPPLLDGVADAFTGLVGTAPTTWTALYGSNLAQIIRTWDGAITGTALPAALDEVRVTINGKPATMYFISAAQVNVLSPLDTATGNVQVVLSNRWGSSPPLQVTKGNYLPAFYAPFGESTGLRVTAVALDGTYVGKPGLDPRVTRGAKPGEILQMFATGFGPTNPSVQSDALFLGAPEVANPPKITIGGKDATFLGKGNLVAPGLYQFNVTVPDVADGDQPIIADAGGVQSSAKVFLTVKR